MEEQNFVKLNYYQIMIFLYGIKKAKEENNYIAKDVDLTFTEISRLAIKNVDEAYYFGDMLKNRKLYKVPRYMCDYLIEIISINPMNTYTKEYKYYKDIIKKIDEQFGDLFYKRFWEIRQRIEQEYDINIKSKSKTRIKKDNV